MGLADRFYMRDQYHSPRLAIKLIWVLIVAFVIQSLLLFYGDISLLNQLALTADGVLNKHRVWQLLTFQFLHSAPWPFHVLINCLVLYFFGRSVEEQIGSKRFAMVYLMAGILGGVLQILVTILLPRHMDIAVVGASAGISGIVAVFCCLSPMQELTTWIYFFPVQIRARTLLIFLSLYSLFGTLVPYDNVANAAHLGGLLTGIVYVRWGRQIGEFFSRFNLQRTGRLKKAKSRDIFDPLSAKRSKRRPEVTYDASEDTFISKQIDPILDKISAKGFQSLTAEERKILESARSKMNRARP